MKIKKKSTDSNASNVILGPITVYPVEKYKTTSNESDNLLGELKDDRCAIESLTVGFYRVYENVKIPSYATEKSACFDIEAYLDIDIIAVDVFNKTNDHGVKNVIFIPEKGKRGIYIEPSECICIPTGFILNIPDNFKMNIYPRSGLSGKHNLKLGNQTGIIDPDYKQQVFILLKNESTRRLVVCHGDRIAQAEFVPFYHCNFKEVFNKPENITNRVGGLGHTGI